MTTMALSMICHSLKEASFLFTGTSNNPRNEFSRSDIATQAYAFIQGTGLDVMIKDFSLDLNADRIRDEFNRIFGTK